MKVALTASQIEFFNLPCPFPLFCAGYGAGKSHTMGFCSVNDALHSPESLIGIYEPDYDLIHSVAVPVIVEWLELFKIKHKPYNKQAHEIISMDPVCGSFKFKTMDDPERLVGYQTYRSHLDELDTLPEDKARTVWHKIMGRNRQSPRGVSEQHKIWSEKYKRWECVNRISAYTTPEGYKFCYNRWGNENTDPNYQMIKGKTEDNPTLTESYIDNLKSSYPAKLIDAYMNGEFVNMKSGTVYHCYDKLKHNSTECIKVGETLSMGCDFNVGKMALTVYVRRNNNKEWHAVAEHFGMLDTPAMIETIKANYHGHHIIIYPDSSGGNRTATDGKASNSCIAQLRQAGFEIRAKSKNPDVVDRINATNTMFTLNRLFVKWITCPQVSRCLLQQAYDKYERPDKSGDVDHQNDATTYPIAYECAIKKNLFPINLKFMQRGEYQNAG